MEEWRICGFSFSFCKPVNQYHERLLEKLHELKISDSNLFRPQAKPIGKLLLDLSGQEELFLGLIEKKQLGNIGL